MSELPAGTVSLEEDTTAAPPVEQPPPQQTAQPPATTEDADPDGTIEGSGGVKFVPLSALAAARQQAREAKAEAATLKGKAAKLDEIEGDWRAAQPMLEKARQMVQTQPPPPKPAGPLSPEEAIEYARDLDLFDADGKPDTARAQRLAGRQQAIAEKQAQQYVAPLMQHTAQGQSRANFEQAANFKGQQGLQVDRTILEQVWQSVPPEMSAQPNVASVLYRQAIAEMVLQGKLKPGQVAPPPPVETASLGGGNHAGSPLSSIDHQFRTAADMSEKDFTATREKYQAGRVNSLE
jgi:hypothetical protein